MRRPLVLLALTCGLLSWAAPATAAAPERSGWWNRLSAPGAALPAPTTEGDDLRVASGAGGSPSAYSAVLLSSPGSDAATLLLQVREGSVLGTPEVLACPTTTVEWPEGPNQPYDAAPPYDCARGQVFGVLAADGLSLSFALDASTASSTGTWSLALVPNPAADAAPFALDLQPPGPESFLPAPPTSSGSGPSDSGSGSSASSGGSSPFVGSGSSGFPSGGFGSGGSLPELPPTTVAPPLLAGSPTVPTAPETAGQSPVLAPARPVLALRPAALGEDVGTGPRLLALLVLTGGSAAVGYAAGQQRSGPRLIGGRARAAGLVPDGPAPDDRPRGHGRFARVRDTAPRRLR